MEILLGICSFSVEILFLNIKDSLIFNCRNGPITNIILLNNQTLLYFNKIEKLKTFESKSLKKKTFNLSKVISPEGSQFAKG